MLTATCSPFPVPNLAAELESPLRCTPLLVVLLPFAILLAPVLWIGLVVVVGRDADREACNA